MTGERMTGMSEEVRTSASKLWQGYDRLVWLPELKFERGCARDGERGIGGTGGRKTGMNDAERTREYEIEASRMGNIDKQIGRQTERQVDT